MAMAPRILLRHPLFHVEGFEIPTRTGTAQVVRMCSPDWVNAVPITSDGQVVLVRQHRWGIDAPSLEIPGGIVDPGEDPIDAARRELLEETGYAGGHWEELGWVWPNPAIQDNRTWMYLARGVEPVAEPSPDSGEDITIELHSLDAVRELIADGTIAHSLAVVSLQSVFLNPLV